MALIHALDAHEKPPDIIRHQYKRLKNLTLHDIDAHSDTIDLGRLRKDNLPSGLQVVERLPRERLARIFGTFLDTQSGFQSLQKMQEDDDIPVYSHEALPGLLLLPSLLTPAVQLELLARLLHRDLSNPAHQTNVHLHYDVAYPGTDEAPSVETNPNDPVPQRLTNKERASSLSFFETDSSLSFLPLDSGVHRPITIEDFLDKKLRWMTLGGQYNWTKKTYPEGIPPPFPDDIAKLLYGLLPDMDAQAAIVNLYSAGDTLSVHRDVSEDCDRGLVSVSLGCDGIFIIGQDNSSTNLALRLRSGDAVYMTGKARFAWHGVPKVLAGTCPEWMKDWPAVDGRVGARISRVWQGWMSNKRINLNVRQITDSEAKDNSDSRS